MIVTVLSFCYGHGPAGAMLRDINELVEISKEAGSGR